MVQRKLPERSTGAVLRKLSIAVTFVLAVGSWGDKTFGGMMSTSMTAETSFNLDLTNADCLKCHVGNIPVLHHALILSDGKLCFDCHKVEADASGTNYAIEVVRDCMVCHGGNVHDTVQHVIQSCADCHHSGTIIEIHTGTPYTGTSTLAVCLRCHTSTVPVVQQTIARGIAGQSVACTDCHIDQHDGRNATP